MEQWVLSEVLDPLRDFTLPKAGLLLGLKLDEAHRTPTSLVFMFI
jgi:hypothetical protein